MSYGLVAAFAIFLFTYLLIAVRRFPGINVRRDVAAVLGGVLMLLFGVVSLRDAWDFIDLDVIFLLLGMMLLVVSLEFCGFFEIIVRRLTSGSSSEVRLLLSIVFLSAFLSAIMLNDAVVLLFTPIVVRCCATAKKNPILYLTALFVSANIGSVATVVGNPQNAYIASKAGIGFLEFSAYLAPLAALSLVAAIAFLLIVHKKRLNRENCILDISLPKAAEVDRIRLFVTVSILAASVFLFGISGFIGIRPCEIALFAGLASLIVVLSKGLSNVIWVAKKVDWSILLFFIGLFVLMAGVVESGLLNEISGLFPGFGEGETPSIAGLTAFSAVLSNLMTNVPSVMLIGEMLPPGDILLWMTLAASSTLAGNATLMGAAANIIVAEESERYGISLNFREYLKIGIPVAFVTLSICIVFMIAVDLYFM